MRIFENNISTLIWNKTNAYFWKQHNINFGNSVNALYRRSEINAF